MKVLKRLSISSQKSLKRKSSFLFKKLINRVKTCKWIGDCFIYTNATNRLSYLIGDQSHVINHFDQGIYLLGYLPAHNRIYVADKDMNILSYALALSVVEYQTAIMRGDMEAAEGMLPDIPADQRNRIARFLEAQGE
jgi:coatomer subunit beta'